jgi:excisionase family DNA binding protein
MQTTATNSTVEQIDRWARTPDESSEMKILLSTHEVGKLLGVSARTVARLADSGQMPRGLKLGRHLRRWRRSDIDSWIADGCPSCRGGAS